MVDSVMKIVDDVLSISRNKKIDRRERFKAMFLPLYKEIEAVHSDYLNGLSKVQQILRETEIESASNSTLLLPEEILTSTITRATAARDFLINHRLTYASLRDKLKAIGRVEDNNKLPFEESSFLRSVATYFITVRYAYAPGPITLQSLIEYIEETLKEVNKIYFFDFPGINSFLDRYIIEHNEKWAEICRRYVQLEIAVWA